MLLGSSRANFLPQTQRKHLRPKRKIWITVVYRPTFSARLRTFKNCKLVIDVSSPFHSPFVFNHLLPFCFVTVCVSWPCGFGDPVGLVTDCVLSPCGFHDTLVLRLFDFSFVLLPFRYRFISFHFITVSFWYHFITNSFRYRFVTVRFDTILLLFWLVSIPFHFVSIPFHYHLVSFRYRLVSFRFVSLLFHYCYYFISVLTMNNRSTKTKHTFFINAVRSNRAGHPVVTLQRGNTALCTYLQCIYLLVSYLQSLQISGYITWIQLKQLVHSLNIIKSTLPDQET